MNQKYHASVSFRQAVLCGLLTILLLAAAPAAWAQRVLAVADIHGNLDGFTSILREAGIINEQGRWVGGNAVLVQTGDIFDRGPNTRGVLDLLMRLEKEAPRSGGKVIVLLGNHEVLNIVGDLRYVSEGEYASFADNGSERRRQRAFNDYSKWLRDRARAARAPAPEITPEMEQEWMARRPLGFVEMREALSPKGAYGSWLRERPVIAKVGDSIFLHGGTHPFLTAMTLDELNARVRDEMKLFDVISAYMVENGLALPFFDLAELTAAAEQELARGKASQPKVLESFLEHPNWVSMHPTGPLWFRGFATWNDQEGEEALGKLLPHYGAARFVTGHTPADDGRIRSRFDHRIFLIDTGMLSSHYENGRPSALEIMEGKITAIYPNKRVVMHAPGGAQMPASKAFGERREIPGGGVAASSGPQTAEGNVYLDASGKPLPFKTDAEVVAFLRSARITRSHTVGQGVLGITRVILRDKNGVEAQAAFRHVNQTLPQFQGELNFRDSYLYEPAAYHLDRMLGINKVPPTALRRLRADGEDKNGSIQFWIENGFTEDTRLKQGRQPPDPTRWSRQMQIMRMFDELVYNVDRNQGNILIDPDWKVWFIDHSRSFRLHRDLRNPDNLTQIERGILERLRNFNEEEARKLMRGLLTRAEVEAMLERRRRLAQHYDQLIAQRGEASVVFSWDEGGTAEPADAQGEE